MICGVKHTNIHDNLTLYVYAVARAAVDQTMAFIRNFMLLLLALIPAFLLHDIDTHKLVSANNELIELECHNTETPELCMECLKSDPKSQYSDEIEIARIITNCLSNHSKHLASNMSGLVVVVSEERLKAACEACSGGYSRAYKHLSEVLSYLKRGDYDKAGHSVLIALKFQLSCQKSIKSQKWSLPESIAYEMKVYEDLSQDAMRIIDRL